MEQIGICAILQGLLGMIVGVVNVVTKKHANGFLF
jgi:hypothetical protein